MRSRDEISKGFLILVWSTVILLTAYLLVQNGVVMDQSEKSSKKQNFADSIIADYSIYLIKKSIILTEYVTSNRCAVIDKNPIIKYFMQRSPIGMYVVENGTEQQSQDEIESDGDEEVSIPFTSDNLPINKLPTGSIGYIFGESYEESSEETAEVTSAMANNQHKIKILKRKHDSSFLLNNFYTIDSTTSVNTSIFHVKELINKNLTIEKNRDKPQILIYHTHATTEAFSDSRKNEVEDTVVGVGRYLAKILAEVYGYQVIHDETKYDIVDGKTDRNKAYTKALPALKEKLNENPSIEVIIDLHRDGVNGKDKRTTMINGKETAQIMFFNGLSRNQNGSIAYLENPNLQGNLAFSLQLKLKAMEKYPYFTRANYLKGYRYNLHLRVRSLLIELGNQNNTVEEAKNAMEPLADLLNQVLSETEEIE